MPGRGRLTIRAEARPPVISVDLIDTGVGMEPDALARMFEPYFSTKATGTGLGLTIAKRNIELIDGTIGLSSTRGVGTTVTITVPMSS
jgi:signal transduction histidine kinase